MQSRHPEADGAKGIRGRELIFVVVIALIGLSVTIRAREAQGVLHQASHIRMTTKTDLPATMSAEVEPLSPCARFFVWQPRVTRRAAACIQSTAPLTVHTRWYSIAVKRRPPPRFLA